MPIRFNANVPSHPPNMLKLKQAEAYTQAIKNCYAGEINSYFKSLEPDRLHPAADHHYSKADNDITNEYDVRRSVYMKKDLLPVHFSEFDTPLEQAGRVFAVCSFPDSLERLNIKRESTLFENYGVDPQVIIGLNKIKEQQHRIVKRMSLAFKNNAPE
jgi:hypothetical protein